jgi:hypothetical protein
MKRNGTNGTFSETRRSEKYVRKWEAKRNWNENNPLFREKITKK